ncbi:NADH dehydrogenase [ubiquinone] 1 beta subcomplex subunit 5, mitochondrial-like [Oppia nitens]|uniref:NADH dehydrogenase [ubiquinone] 1 beta subcomplex subunit 5, mitochondrial-like n=1 Tax=Oppia nitens TaxID=1686743 RepID=UPI0023DC819C|nr:NADH dehydrogenase [ubiquinone] 1 beta subcomplex subunit 5, mitochondrial-like [Oppia nitens]
MVVLSTLKTLTRIETISRVVKRRDARQSMVRLVHAGEFPMRPSVYAWRKFKDFLHFYVMLGVIPLTIFATYVSIRYGPAELAEIPEGYEPEVWEYERNPITRFFAKNIMPDKRHDYEEMVAYFNEESEKIILKKIERMVRDFMKDRSDYQSWYYRHLDAYHMRVEREDWKFLKNHYEGWKDYVVNEKTFREMGDPK